MNKWRSLRLSDDDHTPGQVSHFCKLYSFSNDLSQLETLSIINLKQPTASLFVCHLKLFTNLVSLTIGSVCGKTMPLVQLPNLKHLVISSCMHTNWMKKLQVETLQHSIEHNCTHEHSLTWPISLKRLRVSFRRIGDSEIVRTSLKALSQLTSLAIYDTAWESPAPDGQIWEKLIKSSMPLLKKFQFYFKFWRDFNVASDMKQVVSTFSTPFYLEQKSWFIQCDAQRQQFSIAILYSLPFAFENFEIVTNSFTESISTWNNCSNNKYENSLYENVKELTVNVVCDKFIKLFNPTNVVDLTLKFSCYSIEWLFSMKELSKLTLGHQFNMSSKDFFHLLKNASFLRSLVLSYHTLKLVTNEWKEKAICKLLSQKIHSLELSTDECFPVSIYEYINIYDLLPIVRIFGERCRYLTINVYSRNIVSGFLLPNFQNLRSLKVYLQDHDDHREITKEWLVEQNSKLEQLDYSIVQNGNEYSFWLGRRK